MYVYRKSIVLKLVKQISFNLRQFVGYGFSTFSEMRTQFFVTGLCKSMEDISATSNTPSGYRSSQRPLVKRKRLNKIFGGECVDSIIKPVQNRRIDFMLKHYITRHLATVRP